MSLNDIFNRFEEDWRQSKQATSKTVTIKIAGKTILLHFSDENLSCLLTQALSHVKSDCLEEGLNIFVWDRSQTSGDIPKLPWSYDQFVSHGEICSYSEDNFCIAWQYSSGILSFLDKKKKRALYWIRNREELPIWDLSSPFRSILQWWFEAMGFTMCHTAIVSKLRGVMLVGKGGSGKSTTSMACVKKGLDFLGDDYCLTYVEKSSVKAYSLYNSMKLTPKSLSFFPDLAYSSPSFEKQLVFLDPVSCKNQCLIHTLFVPKITHAPKTEILPITKREALLELFPTSFFQLTYRQRESFSRMSALVKRVNCYQLGLGDDFKEGVLEQLEAYVN